MNRVGSILFQINKLTTREISKCANPTAFGFELERTDGDIRNNATYDEEGNKKPQEVKSVIVQCETIEIRDYLLKTINDKVKEVKSFGDILAFPKEGQSVYAKKCQCREMSVSYM